MAITAKATFFFESSDAEGWSESYYLGATDITAAQSALDTLMPLRQAVLATTMNITYARVSDVAVKGDSLVTTVSLPAAGGYTATGASLLEANTAIQLELFASALFKGRTFLRGLRSDTVVGREYKNPTAFHTALVAFTGGLITASVNMRHRTAVGPPPTYAYHLVTSINVIKATARKPGRPFGLPVGRRRVP